MMKGTEAIVNKIISDSEAKAFGIREEAENSASAVIAGVESELLSIKIKALSDANARGEAIIKHRVTLAELDSKRYGLGRKQAAADAAYDRALEMLFKLSDAEYLEIITKMVQKYAKPGDQIVAGQDDTKRITAAFVSRLSTLIKFPIALSAETEAFKGGIILRSRDYDKNLTFDGIMKSLRNGTESEVIEILFGRK